MVDAYTERERAIDADYWDETTTDTAVTVSLTLTGPRSEECAAELLALLRERIVGVALDGGAVAHAEYIEQEVL